MPLPTRFRRTGPAAAPHTSDTVITCEKSLRRDGQRKSFCVFACWRVGVLACWRVGVLACWRVGVFACLRVKQFRTNGLTAFARTMPMADDQHTSMAFVAPHVDSKYDLLPHLPAFQPHFHSCQTALPSALDTLQNPSIWTTIILLTIANASQLANQIVSQHTTTHPVLSTRPGLVLLMSACLSSFTLVHSLVVICWHAWVI